MYSCHLAHQDKGISNPCEDDKEQAAEHDIGSFVALLSLSKYYFKHYFKSTTSIELPENK